MSIARKNRLKPQNSHKPLTRWQKRVLMPSILALTLSGCASSPTVIAPDCPQPTAVPVALTESDSPGASAYSAKVRSYLQRVQEFLRK